MLFNTGVFIFLFLPAVLLVFHFLASRRWIRMSLAVLLLASCIFYAWANPIFIWIPLVSGVFNFYWGQRLRMSPTRANLFIGLVFNLGLLGYWKYANFIGVTLLHAGVIHATWAKVLLPIGISFYTFKGIAYLLDTYRKSEVVAGSDSLLHFLLYFLFFPDAIAGPIVRHYQFLPQLSSDIFHFDSEHFSRGFVLFNIGLFKKLVIADRLARWVHDPFVQVHQLAFFSSWTAAVTFGLQLYFDFSAYSDMAIGIARMFNIQLPINFDSPYKSKSIIEFWRRWHITLSFFLRDYLYIPLGGNRRGTPRQVINLWTTMVLGGLWHGANWTYVLWGAWHGFMISLNHLWSLRGRALPGWLGQTVTLAGVAFGWALFRSASLTDIAGFVQAMTGLKGLYCTSTSSGDPFFPHFTQKLWLITTGSIALWMPNSQQIAARFRPVPWMIALVVLLFLKNCFSLNSITEFLYYKF